MNEEVEDQLLKMSHHLKKLHKCKSLMNARNEKQNDGKIEINTATSTVRSHVYNLANKMDLTRFVWKKRDTESYFHVYLHFLNSYYSSIDVKNCSFTV